MVCLGNICRSPLAEGILQELAQKKGLHWQVESAGTNGYHNGEAPHPLSQKVANMHGIDISQQRSRKFIQEDITTYDIIYAMANDVLEDIQRIAGKKFSTEKVRLFLEELYPNERKDVPDPWYGNEDGYHKVYDLLYKGCEKIVEKAMKF